MSLLPDTKLPKRWDNPVLAREMLGRMRNPRTFTLLFVYVAALSFVMLTAYAVVAGRQSTLPGDLSAAVSRTLWLWVCSLEAFLLPLVVPALTCGAITMERERDMLSLLLLTRETPARICFGKLFGGIGLAFLLILSTLPVLGICFVLGGVSPAEMAATIASLLATVLLFGGIGLAMSSLCRNTTTAVTTSYAIAGGAVIGWPLSAYLIAMQQDLSRSLPDLAILSMLLTILALTFCPAFVTALVLQGIRSRRGAPKPTRVGWILSVGLCWIGFFTVMYVPSVFDLFAEFSTQAGVLLHFHPVGSVASAMGYDPSNVYYAVHTMSSLPTLSRSHALLIPWCTTAIYSALAYWLFVVSLVQVQRLRTG